MKIKQFTRNYRSCLKNNYIIKNKMKKIIKYIIFIILLLINLSAFAESKINISLSEQNITLDKTFVVTVNIETTYT